MMEINEKDLSEVSGGKLEAVETKDGKFVLTPEGCEHFSSLDDANKKIEEMEKCIVHHLHHGPHGHQLYSGYHIKAGKKPHIPEKQH